jgi:two-component system, OmpR family, phosphate regulon response regulator PhoB
MAAVPDWNSMRKRILIVDDEPAIRDMVAFALRKDDYDVVHAGDAREAQLAIADRVPDLVLLDWMLPGTSGLELARRWRQADLTGDVPIIMLTARGEENDRVGGLEAGVDDYIVKPFSARELLARIRAVMRRSRADDEDGSVSVGHLRIDGAGHRVFAKIRGSEEPVPIGPTEYRLLHFFMTHANRVYTRAQLLDHVWGGSVYIEERTVDVHIRRLRRTLEPVGLQEMIQTVRGAGYRFSAVIDVQAAADPPLAAG